MKSQWNDKEAKKCGRDLLKMRVYTSRLLGQEEDLVLHGGGNTSVKIKKKNIFGQTEEILYVKGSGWNLGTIEAPGFAPVKLEALKQLVKLDELSDMDMVKYQRMAMIDPSAPNPSVETILHGIIPYTFVDHTHADAVVVITNTKSGKARIKEIYGDNMLIVPYVMPGFILAKTIYEMTKNIVWESLDGMILLNHGVFTFDHDPKKSYEKMIAIVSKAERYLRKHKAKEIKGATRSKIDCLILAKIRKSISDISEKPMLSKLDSSPASVGFSSLKTARRISGRGPMTPDHIIRTKRIPVFLGKKIEESIQSFQNSYKEYFRKYNRGEQMLDCAPRWAVYPNYGSLSFGTSVKATKIIEDIIRHTKKLLFKLNN